MCGIAGRFNFDPLRLVDRDVLRAMTDIVAHRGPDQAGYHVAPGIGLGHRRLSIIDLSTGDQPLSNEDGTVWTVFNGEIYNFAEVRAELIAHGHRFRTESDTEVIVHGYEEWGELCVERFRGMFAFAIWDALARRLLLARDRLGVKPLYYAELPGTGRGLRLGAEVAARGSGRAARVAPRGDRRVPDAALRPGARHDLPRHRTSCRPAHVLVAEKGSVRTFALLGSASSPATEIPRREEDYLEELDELLRESVALRQISDVPLGAFLSGGIDSTAVVAYMVETSRRPPLTITVGFDHADYDELSHAQAVAAHLGCDFHTADRHARRRCAAAQAGVALRRAVRRFVRGADLLRLAGGARAGHGRAVGRRRRRALGRLHTAPRRALGTARAPDARPDHGASRAGSARRCRCRSRARARCGISASAPIRPTR